MPVQMIDCSAHGLALHTDFTIDAGNQFLAKLKTDRMILVLYTVRHCRSLGDNHYQIGAQLAGFVGAPDNPQSLLEALRQH